MQEELLTFYLKNKNSWGGLIAACGVLFLVLISGVDHFLSKGIELFVYRLIIYLLIILIFTLVWYKKTQTIPLNKTNKLGIVICIDAENDRERLLIKNDLINKIKELLNVHSFGNEFEVIHLSDHLAKRFVPIIESEQQRVLKVLSTSKDAGLEDKKWLKFKFTTKGIFYIYGNFKTRNEIDEKYILTIHSIVLHKKIDKEKSTKLSREMSSILPREISFNLNQEVSGITITARSLYLASRYIVGIASLISGNFNLAIDLFRNLSKEINATYPAPGPNIKNVLNNSDNYLSESLSRLAEQKYLQGLNQEALDLISEAILLNPKNYGSIILKSVLSFVIEKNIKKSLQETFDAEKSAKNEYGWLYNRAFLYMYSYKFEKGYKCYKKLKELTFHNEELTVDECINFNQTLLNAEPDKLQSLFILGFLYQSKKINYPMAYEYFDNFINLTKNNDKYDYLRTRAESYLVELRRVMDLPNNENQTNGAGVIYF